MDSSRHSVLEHPRRHPPGRYVPPSKAARLQPIRSRPVVAGAARRARGPAWLRLVAILARQGHWAEARSALARARAIDPGAPVDAELVAFLESQAGSGAPVR